MERTTIFIPSDLRRRLVDEAKRRKVPQSELIREALTRFLSGRAERPRLVGSSATPGVRARDAKDWVRAEWGKRAR